MDMLKQLITERLSDLNPDNPDDSLILVQGYGQITLAQAKQKLANYIDRMNTSMLDGKWSEVRALFTSGVPEALAQSIEEAENDLNRMKH